MVRRLLLATVLGGSAAACTGLIGADWDGQSASDAAVDGPGSAADAQSEDADATSPLDTGVDGGAADSTNLSHDASVESAAPADASVYCSVEPGSQSCICGLTPDYGTLQAGCAAADVEPPVLCCATSDWPAASAGAGCTCYTMGCAQIASDTCGCQEEPAEAGAVASCSTGTCCTFGGVGGDQSCTCWTDIPSCDAAATIFPGASPVATCTVAALGCQAGYLQVTDCRP